MKTYYGKHTLADGTTPSHLVHTAWENLFTNPPPYVALDIETPDLKNRRVMGVGIATPDDHNFYFDFIDPQMPWHLFLPSATRKVWHNATFDLSLEALGKFGADVDNIEDTAIIARMLNMDVQLATAAMNTNARTQSVSELFKQYGVKNMEDLPWDVVANKCINDARVTMQFYQKYKSTVNQENYEVERRTTSILLHESHRGIKLDQPMLVDITDELYERVEFFNAALKFNYRSHEQVRKELLMQGLIPRLKYSKKTRKKTYDTGKAELEKFDHTLPKAILEARKYSKLHSTLKGLIGLDRAYSHFHLDSATRRITSEDIQMHNLPAAKRPGDIHPTAGPVRRVLVPDSGEWTRFDLSQIELRVLGQFCQDPTMMAALATKGDELTDIHGTTQTSLGLYSRVIAKNFNFGSIYGGSVPILSAFTGIKDLQLLEGYQQKYFNTYPVMKKWIDQQRVDGLRDGKVTTLHGQELSLAIPIMSGERHAGNCAVNYPIQGSAAEIFKRLLIALLDTVPIEDYVLQVHDEQLFEGWYDLPDELSHMEPFETPLEISHIERWQ